MKKLAILASGNGSNFEAIVKHLKDSVAIRLITDNSRANVVNRATRLKIPYTVIDRAFFATKKEFNHSLFCTLKNFSPNLIALAGYMRILPADITNHFKNMIINIHPSLLPAFKGRNAIKQAFEYGVKYTGITIHYVNEEIDAGKIIEQKIIEISSRESIESLENRIHEIEHSTYPMIIEKILKEER